MADNNDDADDNNIIDEALSDGVAKTKIEHIQSDNPNERLFSVTYYNFEDLIAEIGAPVESSEFSCFGAQWRVSIYPGGNFESSDGMVGLFLERCSEEDRKLAIKYSLTVGFKYGSDRISRQGRSIFWSNEQWGWHDFCLRKELIGSDDEEEKGYLVKRTLTIHVSMELDQCIPKNPASTIMLKLFNDENSADVVFEICEQNNQSESESYRKKAKTSTAKLYHAHRLILQHYSQELSDLCATSDGMTPIVISDVKPEVFRHLLYYVYGGEITEEEYVDNERDLINAADKYGVTNLKLEAEGWFVNNTDITIDNVIDTLLYAHAMNCALLKETVIDFIVENKQDVLDRVSFQDVPGDVCKDLLAATMRYDNEKDSIGYVGENGMDVEKMFSKLRIRDLRRMLDDKGMDMDGSREALIAKLKES